MALHATASGAHTHVRICMRTTRVCPVVWRGRVMLMPTCTRPAQMQRHMASPTRVVPPSMQAVRKAAGATRRQDAPPRRPSCGERHGPCAVCAATATVLWRRYPGRSGDLCNACGLYFKAKHADRPAHLWGQPSASVASASAFEATPAAATETTWPGREPEPGVMPKPKHVPQPAAIARYGTRCAAARAAVAAAVAAAAPAIIHNRTVLAGRPGVRGHRRKGLTTAP